MNVPLVQTLLECDVCGKRVVITHTFPFKFPQNWGRVTFIGEKPGQDKLELCPECYENAKTVSGHSSKSQSGQN